MTNEVNVLFASLLIIVKNIIPNLPLPQLPLLRLTFDTIAINAARHEKYSREHSRSRTAHGQDGVTIRR
jgi:hypothetical protein